MSASNALEVNREFRPRPMSQSSAQEPETDRGTGRLVRPDFVPTVSPCSQEGTRFHPC